MTKIILQDNYIKGISKIKYRQNIIQTNFINNLHLIMHKKKIYDELDICENKILNIFYILSIILFEIYYILLYYILYLNLLHNLNKIKFYLLIDLIIKYLIFFK